MYFSFFKLKKWGKKAAAARRHNCAVLPYILRPMSSGATERKSFFHLRYINIFLTKNKCIQYPQPQELPEWPLPTKSRQFLWLKST